MRFTRQQAGLLDALLASEPQATGDAVFERVREELRSFEENFGHGIAVDGDGNAYVAGSSSSADFPTVNPFDGSLDGNNDAIVAKLNPTGSALVYSTYLGGSEGETTSYSITVDADGNAHVAGFTFSTDFPAQNPFQACTGGDSFVTKLNDAGSGLLYSTCGLGGDDIAVDPSGNIYTGDEKIDSSQTGANQVVDTYPISINALDASCNAYDATGTTSSNNFPTVSSLIPFQSLKDVGNDAFAQKSGEAGPFAYISNFRDDTVSVIDTASNTIVATVNVGDGLYGVAVSPDGTLVYVTNELDDTVSIINAADNTVLPNPVPVGDQPQGVAVSPDGAEVYVANSGSDNVSVIETANHTVTDTVNVEDGPQGLAFTPDGLEVYVANKADGSVSVIDTTTNPPSVTDTIPLGAFDGPHGVAVTPDGSKVYVTNGFSNTVTVITTVNNARDYSGRRR